MNSPEPTDDSENAHLDTSSTLTLRPKSSWLGSIKSAIHQGAVTAQNAIDSLRVRRDGGSTLVESNKPDTPRVSLDTATSENVTPKSGRRLLRRHTLSTRSAVSSLRSHIPSRSKSAKSKRGSISSVFGRSDSVKAAFRGACGPEVYVGDNEDAADKRDSTDVRAEEAATWVPLPSSPIRIPAPAALTLRTDFDTPMLLPRFDTSEATAASLRALQDPANITTGVPVPHLLRQQEIAQVKHDGTRSNELRPSFSTRRKTVTFEPFPPFSSIAGSGSVELASSPMPGTQAHLKLESGVADRPEALQAVPGLEVSNNDSISAHEAECPASNICIDAATSTFPLLHPQTQSSITPQLPSDQQHLQATMGKHPRSSEQTFDDLSEHYNMNISIDNSPASPPKSFNEAQQRKKRSKKLPKPRSPLQEPMPLELDMARPKTSTPREVSLNNDTASSTVQKPSGFSLLAAMLNAEHQPNEATNPGQALPEMPDPVRRQSSGNVDKLRLNYRAKHRSVDTQWDDNFGEQKAVQKPPGNGEPVGHDVKFEATMREDREKACVERERAASVAMKQLDLAFGPRLVAESEQVGTVSKTVAQVRDTAGKKDDAADVDDRIVSKEFEEAEDREKACVERERAAPVAIKQVDLAFGPRLAAESEQAGTVSMTAAQLKDPAAEHDAAVDVDDRIVSKEIEQAEDLISREWMSDLFSGSRGQPSDIFSATLKDTFQGRSWTIDRDPPPTDTEPPHSSTFHGPPSPTRQVQLPLRPRPNGKQSVRGTYFPAVKVDHDMPSPAHRQSSTNSDLNSIRTSQASRHISTSSKRSHENLPTASPSVSSVLKAAGYPYGKISVENRTPSPASRATPLRANDDSEKPTSSPASSANRTPSMGDRQAFDQQRAERNARYNALASSTWSNSAAFGDDGRREDPILCFMGLDGVGSDDVAPRFPQDMLFPGAGGTGLSQSPRTVTNLEAPSPPPPIEHVLEFLTNRTSESEMLKPMLPAGGVLPDIFTSKQVRPPQSVPKPSAGVFPAGIRGFKPKNAIICTMDPKTLNPEAAASRLSLPTEKVFHDRMYGPDSAMSAEPDSRYDNDLQDELFIRAAMHRKMGHQFRPAFAKPVTPDDAPAAPVGERTLESTTVHDPDPMMIRRDGSGRIVVADGSGPADETTGAARLNETDVPGRRLMPRDFLARRHGPSG